MAFIQKSIGIATGLMLSLNAVLLASVLDNPLHTTFADCDTVGGGNCIAAERRCSTASGEKCIIPTLEEVREITKKTDKGKELKAKIEAQKQKWTTGNEFWCSDSTAPDNHIKCQQVGDKQRKAIGCGYEWSQTKEDGGIVVKHDAAPLVAPNRFAKSKNEKKLYVCVQDKDKSNKLTAEQYAIQGDGSDQIAKLNNAGIKGAM